MKYQTGDCDCLNGSQASVSCYPDKAPTQILLVVQGTVFLKERRKFPCHPQDIKESESCLDLRSRVAVN